MTIIEKIEKAAGDVYETSGETEYFRGMCASLAYMLNPYNPSTDAAMARVLETRHQQTPKPKLKLKRKKTK